MSIPAFAPGCFGSALLYSDNDLVCAGCPYATECLPAHIEARDALRALMGFDAITDKRRNKLVEKIKALEPEPPLDPALVERFTATLRKIDSAVSINQTMLSGRNPFDGSALRVMDILCKQILENGGRALRETIVRLLTRAGFVEVAARQQVRLAIAAMVAIGAMRLEGDVAILENL